MSTKEFKNCYNCEHYRKFYLKVMASLQVDGCGRCMNISAKRNAIVDQYDCCDKWEEKQKKDNCNAQSVIDEISDISSRLKAVLYELKKFP